MYCARLDILAFQQPEFACLARFLQQRPVIVATRHTTGMRAAVLNAIFFLNQVS
jgi:hypothetical protein